MEIKRTVPAYICPKCKSDLTGEPIRKEYLSYYATGITHYSRLIAIYDRDLDRTVEFMCPDCGHRWGW